MAKSGVVLKDTARIGVVNRGEAAFRFIRAARDFNNLYGTRFEVVAFCTDGERDALFAQEADECFPLSSFGGSGGGGAYLDRALMMRALLGAGCSAVWPGWGFLSEDAEFVSLVEGAGLVFLGPSSRSMGLLGDKIRAKELAQGSSTPVCPWSEGPVRDLAAARAVSAKIGFPVIVKASNAGGGRGIRFALSASDLAGAFSAAVEETRRVTGNSVVFIERLVESGRHMEVQVLADRLGNVLTFGVRDCSIQRKNQKIIEETPPPNFDEAVIKEMEAAAARLIKAAGYQSAGTVEFLYDIKRGEFYFMEVNTRLQVEHPVTEELYGVDLVQGQLLVARGESVAALASSPRGVVIEARLNAEDPSRDFLPAPGRVTRFRVPSGPGLRVDSGFAEGSFIPPDFDSMAAKIIASGRDRASAVGRLRRALSELRIKIDGGTTNRAFLLSLLANKDIRRGGVHTRFVEELLASGGAAGEKAGWSLAVAAAAVEQYLARSGEDFANFSQQMFTFGSPRDLRPGAGHEAQITALGAGYRFLVRCLGEDRFFLSLNEAAGDSAGSSGGTGGARAPSGGDLGGPDGLAGGFSLRYVKNENEAFLFAGGRRHHVQLGQRGDTLQVEVDGIPYEFETESGGLIKAPSPAVVLSVQAVPGKAVSAGDVLLTLEAMKMEMLIPAPREGLVREIRVKAGEQVGAGQVLAVLEAGEKKAASGGAGAGSGAESGKGGRARGAKKISFRDFCGGGDRDEWQRLSSDFYSVFAGFDTPAEARLCFDRMADFVLGHLEFAPAFRGLIVRAIEFFVAIESVFALRRGQEDGFGRFGAQAQELVAHYFRRSVNREKGLPESFTRAVDRVFALYNVKADGPVDILRRVFFHIFRSRANGGLKQHLLLAAFSALENFPAGGEASAKSVAASAEHSRVRGESARLEGLLDELARLTQAQMPSLADAAINARYRLFDREKLEDIEEKKRARVKRLLDLALRARAQGRQASEFFERLQDLGDSSTAEFVSLVLDAEDAKTASLSLEALCLRMNRDRQCGKPEIFSRSGQRLAALSAKGEDGEHESILAVTDEKKFAECMELCAAYCKNRSVEMNLYVRGTDAASFFAGQGKSLKKLPPKTVWACVGFLSGTEVSYRSYAKRGSSWQEDAGRASLSPLAYRELRIFRLSAFDTQLLRSGEGFYLFHIVSPENPKDERLIACVEVSSTRAEFTEDGAIGRMVAFEKTFMDALYALRAEQIQRRNRLHWNRIVIHMRPVLGATINQIQDYASLLAARTLDLGIERLSIYCRLAEQDRGAASFPAHTHGAQEKELLFDNIVGTSFTLDSREPVREPLHAIDGYAAKVVRARQRGTFYPYEVIKMLTSSGASSSEEFFPGEFEEFDLAESPVKAEGSAQPENQNTPKKPKKPDTQDKRAKAAPETWTPEKTYRSVSGRPYGENEGNIVFGIISNRLPDGRNIRRVLIVSDPSYDLCSLTEAECRRVSAALDLAEDLGIPAEFLPVSSGARVDMDSGTENLDWTASTLKRIIEYTQSGRELNIVVAGVNVGAQSYWNAEATMLMHTRGLLIMTEDASMLLTGKKALDFSGSVSSENNVGIGGAMKIMEPNGQAQIRVKNLKEACVLLLRHYSLTYREPGRLWPDRAATTDPTERNAGLFPYKDTLGQGFATIGDIFSAKHNPERKKPFDIRQVMAALTDQDQPRLERWGGMRDAETAVVWEARIAGYSAGLIGIESQALPRQGEVPYDGPETWSGGTLFPLSSKKTARAINAFSGRLPLVLLANLSGFDGSPESLRKLQLEYGAEIGRAVVNFRGPFIFVVIGRYHGGAYVVFSKHLNPNLHSAALEGARASVIGGAPAAAVVFPSLVLKDTHEDPALVKAREKLKTGAGFSQKDYEEVFRKVHAEKQSALAARFDRIHSVERAKKVGSIDAIITIKDLRPYVAAQIEKSLGE